MVEVGKRYYFMVHAYYHYVGTVVEILGVGRYTLKDAVRVHSCGRDFTRFFADGFGTDTVWTAWPDGMDIAGVFVNAPFNHPTPVESRNGSA